MSRARQLLFVDEDDVFSDGIRAALEDHYVTVVSRGVEGWRRVEDGEPFDIILSEVRVRGITAAEMAYLAEKAGDHGTPLVFMTTGVLSDAELAFVRHTPHLVLLKPFTVGQLLLFLKTASDALMPTRERAG